MQMEGEGQLMEDGGVDGNVDVEMAWMIVRHFFDHVAQLVVVMAVVMVIVVVYLFVVVVNVVIL